MRFLAVSVGVGIIGMCIGAVSVQGRDAATREIKPCVVISGVDSHIKERQCHRITSNEDWGRLWQVHKGKKPDDSYDAFYDPLTLPVVNFDDSMVIAVFLGPQHNIAGLKVESIREGDADIVFRFDKKTYQTVVDSKEMLDRAPKLTPYGFFIVPRSKKAMVVQEDVHNEMDEPPVWKEFASFPPLGEGVKTPNANRKQALVTSPKASSDASRERPKDRTKGGER